jgi:hypothetical protein
MQLRILTICVALACSILAGCSNKMRVGGYVLVTPPTLGPDSNPGTSLSHNGATIWRNVYVGYFYPHAASVFFHDGCLIFVGPVPDEDHWWIYPQVFAVAGGSPIVLSERLFERPLVVSHYAGRGSNYGVRHIEPASDGVAVTFEYWPDSDHQDVTRVVVTWDQIKSMLSETVAMRTVRSSLGDYRILSQKRPNQQPERTAGLRPAAAHL